MNRKQRIKELLLNKFDDFSIEIIDRSNLHAGHNNFDGNNETHLQILLKSKINSNINSNINRLDIHRKINELIKNEFEMGLHSIEIKIN